MNLFNQLPGFARSPAGMERVVLRRLPAVLLGGSLLLGLPSVIAHIAAWPGSEADTLVRIATVDIAAISVLVLHWTAVLTVAIAAMIVLVMKGPAYIADPYTLPDADRPDPQGPR
ncbi:MAG: hypothetical protein WCA12_15525 [Burkholderiales bacterium]